MKTGYFRKIVSIDDQRNIVSISLGQPKWAYVPHKYKSLAPAYILLRDFQAEKVSEAEYVERYSSYLHKHLSAEKVYEEILGLTDNPILCCHCAPKHFCHRHLAAEWLETSLGILLPEYKSEKTDRLNGRIVTLDQSNQTTLF